MRVALRGKRWFCPEGHTTYGVVKEKTPKGAGFRFKVEFWASNEEGQTKTIGWTEVDVGV